MQLTQGHDRSRLIATGVVVALILAVGVIAQAVAVANGIYLITVHFSPSDLASVPGETLGQMRTRGYIAISVGVFPVIAGLVAGAFARASGVRWLPSLRRAAIFAAGADILVLFFVMGTSV